MGGPIFSLAAIAVIVGFAICFIAKSKKSGQKCIGCPSSKTCSGNCSGAQDSTTNDDEDLDSYLD